MRSATGPLTFETLSCEADSPSRLKRLRYHVDEGWRRILILQRDDRTLLRAFPHGLSTQRAIVLCRPMQPSGLVEHDN